MNFISLPDTSENATEQGGKASRLALLRRAGFTVPEYFVVTTEAFWHCLPEASRLELESARSFKEAEAIVSRLKMTASVKREIEETAARFFKDGVSLAVRSSALQEDGDEHSFAGQFESYLRVTPNLVANRVMDVWRSAFSERAFLYRKLQSIDSPLSPPAVIVQRLLDATFAGVAFSVDPTPGARLQTDNVLVNAVSGLADRLVSGEAESDVYSVSRDGSVTIANLAGTGALLSESQIKQVSALAIDCERFFGSPQDIEWVLEGCRLFIVQSRPITTLERKSRRASGAPGVSPESSWSADVSSAPASTERKIWDNSNIGESYQGITTPLTFSFARKAYEHVYIHFVRMMGVPESRIRMNEEIFPSMLGYIRGRIYYNLINWYKLLAMLPGFRVNRKFMEQMMGVKEELPAEIVNGIEKGSSSGRMLELFFLVNSVLLTIWNLVTLERQVKRFRTHFNATLASVPKNLDGVSVDELARIYRGLERKLLSRWDAPLINDFFAMIFFGITTRYANRIARPGSANSLLVGLGGIVSTEPADLMNEMAEAVYTDSSFVDCLLNGSAAEIKSMSWERIRFATLFNRYIEKFGDRCVNELKLESQTLSDNPLPLLRNVGQIALQLSLGEGRPRNNGRSVTRLQAEQEAMKAIGRNPLKRWLFRRLLNQAKARIQTRENLRFERTRLFGVVRKLFMAFGRKFVAIGLLRQAEDVFYLEVQEVLGFVEGTAASASLQEIVDTRRAEIERYKSMPAPPDRIETTELPQLVTDFAAGRCGWQAASAKVQSGALSEGGNERQGLGCCPGVVRGKARVVIDPATCSPLNGEILIAKRTDPGWILLFAHARGIVVEHGSLLSHTAIVSRELGIPAIVSVPGLTTWLKDGDEIEFDGSTGVIRKVSIDQTASPPDNQIAIQSESGSVNRALSKAS